MIKSSYRLLLFFLLLLPLASLAQDEITWQKDGKVMVLIPAGAFEIGDHFWMGEVERRQYVQ